MWRFVGSLIFASGALVGCAPLPALVTDSLVSERQTESDTVDILDTASHEIISASDTLTPTTSPETFVAIPPVAENAKATDSLDSITSPVPNNLSTMPPELNRPLQVGLLVGVSYANLTGKGSLMLSFNGDASEKHPAKGVLSVKRGKIVWQEENGPSYSTDSLIIDPSENELINLEKKNYRGRLRVSIQKGKLLIINSVSIEDYLKGVVPYEIGTLDSEAVEALKAQAVAARTYAYRHFGSRASQGFDVYADVKDQVYNGASGEVALTNTAVDATVGEVLTFDGTFIEAYYHSTCGGYTENLETWGQRGLPYLQSKPDFRPDGKAWCNESSYSHWKWIYTEKEFPELLRKNAADAKADKIPNFTKINEITILDRLPGGRVKTLLVETNKGTIKVKNDRTRWLFKRGTKILPSSNFEISKERDHWVIKGRGFGHGVGMCQMGVRARARAGQTYQEILSHYYPGTSLERLVP